jgi:lipoprotein-releasing system permease protein
LTLLRRFELFVALRYLRARRKQAFISVVTLISVVGVTAGVTALIIALALNAGFQTEFQDRILGATSHVNLLNFASGPISDYSGVIERTRGLPQVTSVEPAVYGQSLLQSELRQQPAILKGIDGETYRSSPELLPRIMEGNLEDFAWPGSVTPIMLGKDLASSLGVLVGDNIRALGMEGQLSPLGRMPKVQSFRVVALFDSGLWDFDANWALVPMEGAQRFFGLSDNQVSALEYRIRDIYAAPQAAERIKEAAGRGFTTSTWIELNRPLFSALRLERLAMFIAIGLIVLVASLNIISTLTLMVMEKNREIAIITAMGGTARTITRIFVLQGLIIGVLGTLFGAAFGTLTAWYLNEYKVFRLEPEVYSIPYVPFRLEMSDVVVVCLLAVLVSFLATLYPARSAARLDPIESLRYE